MRNYRTNKKSTVQIEWRCDIAIGLILPINDGHYPQRWSIALNASGFEHVVNWWVEEVVAVIAECFNGDSQYDIKHRLLVIACG